MILSARLHVNSRVVRFAATATLLAVSLHSACGQEAARGEAAGREDSPAEPASPPASNALESLVIVKLSYRGEQESFAGIVVKQKDGKAYVLMQSPNSRWRNLRNNEAACRIIALRDGEEIEVEAKRLPDINPWIITAAADKMPKPISSPVAESLEVGVPLWILGLRYASGKRPSLVKVAAPARLASPIDIELFGAQHFSLTTRLAETVDVALIVTEDGKPLGFKGRISPRRDKEEYPVLCEVLASIELERPTLHSIAAYPHSGDREQIHWEIVLEVSDLFGSAAERELRVRELDRETFKSWSAPFRARRSSEPAFQDGEVLELSEGPSDFAQSQMGSRTPGARYYVARYTTENPCPRLVEEGKAGTAYFHFETQLSYKGADDSKSYYPVRAIEYSRSFSRGNFLRNFPRIPVFDGRPPEYVVKRDDGTYLVTTDLTRVEETPATEPRTEFPQPVAGDESLAGEATKLADKFDVVKLKMKVQPENPFGNVGAFSPDGSALILSDDRGTLHRIRTSDLHKTASLSLPYFCTGLAFSNAGLVIKLGSKQIVWIADPETLRVKREISLPPLIHKIAATPDGVIGFVKAMDEDHIPMTLYRMVNFETGEYLHQFPGRHRLNVDGKDLFPNAPGVFRMHGKYWYFSDGPYLRRFRLDGNNLIYEGQATGLVSGAISGDGEAIAVFEKPTSHIHLFDGSDLAEPKLTFEAKDGVVKSGFAADQLFVAGRENLTVFDRAGRELRSALLGDLRPRHLIANPRGGQILVWHHFSDVFFIKIKTDAIPQGGPKG